MINVGLCKNNIRLEGTAYYIYLFLVEDRLKFGRKKFLLIGGNKLELLSIIEPFRNKVA